MEVGLRNAFRRLCNRLSPENLTADGEIRGRAVTARKAQIMREWKALEALAGGKVSQSAVEDHDMQEHHAGFVARKDHPAFKG
jgi:hypothetical protein